VKMTGCRICGDYLQGGNLCDACAANEARQVARSVSRIAFPLEEIATMLGVTVFTVRGWVTRGHMRAYKIGKRRFVRAEDIEEALTRTPVRPRGSEDE